MKKDMKHVTKDCPGPKLSFGQRRVDHDTDSTCEEDDGNEQYMLKVGKEVDHFFTVERDEVCVLDPNIFFHLMPTCHSVISTRAKCEVLSI